MITELKAKTRRAIHGVFSVRAQYQDFTMAAAVDITVRWHHRIDRFGDIESGGYAEQIDGIERAIFNREELAEKGVVLRRRGLVTLTEGEWGGAVLRLDTKEPRDGPVEEIWGVAAIGD